MTDNKPTRSAGDALVALSLSVDGFHLAMAHVGQAMATLAALSADDWMYEPHPHAVRYQRIAAAILGVCLGIIIDAARRAGS